MTATQPAPLTARELTVRGVLLGGAITLVFTAANVYLGLKVGLTFATAIPAAVISMAVLRNFANHSIVENNIVQTVASAAGTLSAIIFVLPGLVMVGWWSGFPYWTTVAVCAVGGILGVMYSIPLRRALVTGSDLPYPEGVAAAEVLKVGDSSRGTHESRAGLRAITTGALAAAGFALLANVKVWASEIALYFRAGPGATMFGGSLSLALIGVGHLVGVSVGMAMLVGLVISFGILLPVRTIGDLAAGLPLADVVDDVFVHQVRFIGAGAIAVAAIWTLIKILRPIVRGVTEALASARTRKAGGLVDVTERDIPFPIVSGSVVVMLVPIAFLLEGFVHGTVLGGHSFGIIAASLAFIFVIGLVIAAICGYMAGLIGSSNSPISGVGILVVLIAAVLIKLVFGPAESDQSTALVAFTLFAAAITFGVATISNDNLQDLKTGQLVGATPWKQQVALVIACCSAPRLSAGAGADALRVRFHGDPGRRAGGARGAAGRAHLVAGRRRVRGVAGLGAARAGRGDRRRDHRGRRAAGAAGVRAKLAAAAVGRRDGHVPADVADADHPDRGVPRPRLQPVG